MSTKHTPGSWIVVAGANPNDKGIHDSHFGHDGLTFAKISFAHEYAHMPEYGAEMADRYARKVAALPDLLSVMERIEPYLDAIVCYASTCGEHEPNAIVRDFRAAIAKATGAGS